MKSTPIAPPAAAARSPAARRADALPAGTLIDGCEIVRVVADSHFAILYFARETGSERRFAIKEYLPVSLALRSADGRGVALRAPEHAAAFERGLLAFSAEARLLEQRTHPALLRVLRSARGHGTVCRVMPWLDGDTLFALRRSLPEPPDEAALKRLLFGLLGALQTLHDAGEVHGAVSPGNILVLADDRPVLMDTAAVARSLVGDQTRALMAMVSPGFAPRGPVAATADEGAASGAVGTADGVAADLHALAAVAHFCISGTLPAAGERHAPLTDVVRGLRLRASRPPYSAKLITAIDAALSDDLARRPASVAAFRAALSGQAEAARAAAADGPAPVLAMTAAPHPPKDALSPERTAGSRVRYPGERRRNSHRLAWWGGGALLALTLTAVGLVVVNERAAIALRADGFSAPALRDLAPPSALPARAATGRVAVPGEPGTAAARVAPVPATARPEKPARATERVPAAKEPKAKPPAEDKLPKAPKPARTPEPATSPRAECGARTDFALYRCMKTECQLPRWAKHPECQRLRATDSVE